MSIEPQQDGMPVLPNKPRSEVQRRPEVDWTQEFGYNRYRYFLPPERAEGAVANAVIAIHAKAWEGNEGFGGEPWQDALVQTIQQEADRQALKTRTYLINYYNTHLEEARTQEVTRELALLSPQTEPRSLLAKLTPFYLLAKPTRPRQEQEQKTPRLNPGWHPNAHYDSFPGHYSFLSIKQSYELEMKEGHAALDVPFPDFEGMKGLPITLLAEYWPIQDVLGTRSPFDYIRRITQVLGLNYDGLMKNIMQSNIDHSILYAIKESHRPDNDPVMLALRNNKYETPEQVALIWSKLTPAEKARMTKPHIIHPFVDIRAPLSEGSSKASLRILLPIAQASVSYNEKTHRLDTLDLVAKTDHGSNRVCCNVYPELHPTTSHEELLALRRKGQEIAKQLQPEEKKR